MVHLLQVSVILTAAVLLLVGGLIIYGSYYSNTSSNVTEVIKIISNQTGLSSVSGNQSDGGAVVVSAGGNETAPTIGNITLPSNVQILQNEINNTRYTAILITENLTS